VCTGTGDVALAAVRTGRGPRLAIGVDFAAAMLTRAREKAHVAGLSGRVQLVRGDAASLPVPGNAVDGITIAFGIRNVAHPESVCAELLRTLKPGGRLAILEFGLPVIPGIRTLYLLYFRHVLPRIGRAVSRHDAAYSYLPESVHAFPWGDAFAQLLRAQGFNNVTSRPLTFGSVYLYTAEKSRSVE
jgi:demethylmenaquinone methyltransferase / 2-methoxy-6-polyprenyl-1,4-benzoquinol methylase